MKRSYYNLERINEKLAFLLVICRLNDAQKPFIRYEADGDEEEVDELTPLEDLLVHWSTLVNMQSDDDIVEQGTVLMSFIKSEVKKIKHLFLPESI